MLAVEQPAPVCPLCGGGDLATLEARGKPYLDCAACRLVHLAPAHRLDRDGERAHYTTHENDPADPGYRQFLERVAGPLAALLAPGAEGLDYGSGPGPTLSVLFRERGFAVTDYDPFFAPIPAALERVYDFVTCTEVVEHFFRPGAEFARLGALLRPGGRLAVMTEILGDDVVFARWWYPRDPTHVCFYRPATFEWIARHHGWSYRTLARNVALFEAPA